MSESLDVDTNNYWDLFEGELLGALLRYATDTTPGKIGNYCKDTVKGHNKGNCVYCYRVGEIMLETYCKIHYRKSNRHGHL